MANESQTEARETFDKSLVSVTDGIGKHIGIEGCSIDSERLGDMHSLLAGIRALVTRCPRPEPSIPDSRITLLFGPPEMSESPPTNVVTRSNVSIRFSLSPNASLRRYSHSCLYGE